MFVTVSVFICVSFTCPNVIHQRENSLGGSISSWHTQTELDHREDISTRYILLVEVRKQLNPSFVDIAMCLHFHLAHVKSGQIRDARPKTGQIGVPGDL